MSRPGGGEARAENGSNHDNSHDLALKHGGGNVGGRQLLTLSLAALGVVFGDIGTSPLYVIRECFGEAYGLEVNTPNVLGALSLIFWALVIIVTVKYLKFILRADNGGEGGVLALMTLVHQASQKKQVNRWLLIALGLFGAALLYGDGIITPAISVLSAVEGMESIAPGMKHFVIPSTIVILGGLFFLQYKGTAGVGALFGPVILMWFAVIGGLGLVSIIKTPIVLSAVLPWHGAMFFVHNKVHGFLALGAVCLSVTGAEALYADLGHFGRKPINLVWTFLAMPALMMNYFGQGALLLAHPEMTHHPFYALVPKWGIIPMVILSTAATVIASQAVISGAYSLTRQAMLTGYLPRMRILHTSHSHIGQIYVPAINWMLMIACIGLVLAFKSSSNLAAAYGVAVTSTMFISSLLFYVVAREQWGWGRVPTSALVGVFLVIDLSLLSSNMTKIIHGAWVPLALGAVIYLLMTTWKKGREALYLEMKKRSMSFNEFLEMIKENPPQRVPGKAVFMTGNPDMVPPALIKNYMQNKILHEEIAVLNYRVAESPRVPNNKKVQVHNLGDGIYRVSTTNGYMESPEIGKTLELAEKQGLDFSMKNTSFFLGRERLIPTGVTMNKHRAGLFAFMSRNAQDATAFFEIPTEQVMEVGVQLRI